MFHFFICKLYFDKTLELKKSKSKVLQQSGKCLRIVATRQIFILGGLPLSLTFSDLCWSDLSNCRTCGLKTSRLSVRNIQQTFMCMPAPFCPSSPHSVKPTQNWVLGQKLGNDYNALLSCVMLDNVVFLVSRQLVYQLQYKF